MTDRADMPCEVLALESDVVRLRVRERVGSHDLLWALLGSHAMAHRVLVQGRLRRDDCKVWNGATLEPGEELCLQLRRPADLRVLGKGPVEVVYQDRALVAVDKPAGLLVHGDGTGAETLTERVQGLLASRDIPAVAQAVQRLDVETTGLVLFSLTEEFQPRLDAQVAGHDMRKRYLAVVEGRLAGSEGEWLELTGPIARDRHDARRMRVGASGKPALTRVRTLARNGRYRLLLVELGTGRRHQIRVHLAHAGHPLLGDALYGGHAWQDGLMLHAWQEELRHPVTCEPLHLQTAWPARFAPLFPEGSLTALP